MTTAYQRSSVLRAIAICIVCACLMRLAGCIAFAGAPQLRTVLPVIQPPKSITVTSSIPAVIYVSPDLREPFSPITGWSTNRLQLSADMERQFFSAVANSFPLTNERVVVKWRTVPEAASYRIYLGDARTNWHSLIETPNRTQLTTTLWKCYATNTLAMTSINSNGVESALSKIGQWSPQLRLGIRVN